MLNFFVYRPWIRDVFWMGPPEPEGTGSKKHLKSKLFAILKNKIEDATVKKVKRAALPAEWCFQLRPCSLALTTRRTYGRAHVAREHRVYTGRIYIAHGAKERAVA